MLRRPLVPPSPPLAPAPLLLVLLCAALLATQVAGLFSRSRQLTQSTSKVSILTNSTFMTGQESTRLGSSQNPLKDSVTPGGPLPPFPDIEHLSVPPSPPTPPAAPGAPASPAIPEWRSAWRARYAPVWERCPGGTCLAIVAIVSYAHNYGERMRHRRTYMQELLRPRGIQYIFVMSQPHVQYNHSHVEWEFEQYGDMLMMDSPGCNNKNIQWCSLKLYYLLEWVAKVVGPGRADFWVKSELDSLLNPYGLKLHLLQLPRTRAFMGRWCGYGRGEPRGDQSFFAGGMYVISWDMARWLAVDSPLARGGPNHKHRKESVGADDIMASEWFRDFVPVIKWFPLQPCECHDAWDTAYGGCAMKYPTNNHTILVHNVKTHAEWWRNYAQLLPLIMDWRAACEPSADSDNATATWQWSSPQCLARLPPIPPCLTRECPQPRRHCPLELDAQWNQTCPWPQQ